MCAIKNIESLLIKLKIRVYFFGQKAKDSFGDSITSKHIEGVRYERDKLLLCL
jgi:hypothetical protein